MKRYLSPIVLIALAMTGSIAVYSSYNSTPSLDNKSTDVKIETTVEKPIKWVEDKLKSMTTREKVGQFFMVAAYSNKPESHLQKIDSMIIKDGIGGVIFFQGERDNLITSIERFQSKAKTPLLVGMDAEWGVQMRLFGEERFPYNYTIGAAGDPELTERIAQMMGQECRELGIHLNFAPVADVNSNPNNPVIGFRSYGENPKDVASHVVAAVNGMEGQGVMTSIKHFPGHGDTDTDSHKELPIVNNSLTEIDAIHFFPFRAGIKAGASTVMIGHLNVPALDPSGTPSSLSEPIIQSHLKQDLGFRGLVVSDALGMKAVANKYGKTEVVVKAFEAGCDILLFPESISDAIDALTKKVEKGEISEIALNERCKKVLIAKYEHIVNPPKFKTFTEGEVELVRNQLYEKAITVVKNDQQIFPIKTFNKKVVHVSIGPHADPLAESIDLVADVDHYHFYNVGRAMAVMQSKFKEYDLIITSLHSDGVTARNDYGLPTRWREWTQFVPQDKKNALVLFGNPLAMRKNFDGSHFEAIVVGYENHPLMLKRMGQFLVGSATASGKLPITVSNEFKRGTGVQIDGAGRLKESQPEELGVDPKKLAEIDSIAMNSIRNGVFPGCQIVVAVKGNVIYRKSFGHHTYKNDRAVQNSDVYDIASITKIAASTLSLMRLNSEGKFDLNSRIENYLPELTNGTAYSNIRLKDMMAHQAGLFPWIPFYTETLDKGRLNDSIYSNSRDQEHSVQVAKNLWILHGYEKMMYDQILKKPLKSKKYKYSDLGYYFVKKIIEKQTNQELDQYVLKTFYEPMGLRYMRYNPLDYFTLNEIPPTENDTIFRKQQIHGYVHDQGASMMGGVGGHAGLFSNAGDLAGLMQLFLNKGTYGGVRYIDADVIDQYTSYQFYPKNRRGAGFDKPTTNGKGGPTTNLVSKTSFGHSGFTGTLAWADPEYQINYVFLSNRVYPDAENWKIVSMNVRTDIQRVIYEAVNSAK